MKKQKIILDVDTGVDDAIALLYAFLCDELDIKLISVIGGNVKVNQSTLNTLYMTQNFARYPIPVVKGSSKPLKKALPAKLGVHGKKGLGNVIEVTQTKLKPINSRGYGASEALRDAVLNNKNEVTIVCQGPSTNVALALQKYPQITPFIQKILVMGGSLDGSGSITKYAGFNVYCDPDACDIIVKSGIPIVFSPKEIGLNTYLTQPILDRWAKLSKTGEAVKNLYNGYHDLLLPADKFATHDLCAVMSIVKPQYFKTKPVLVKVNTTDGRKRGQTIFEEAQQSHISLIYQADRRKIIKEFDRKLQKTRG